MTRSLLLGLQAAEAPLRQGIASPPPPSPRDAGASTQPRSPQLLPVLHPSSGSWVHPWTGGDWAPTLQRGQSAEVRRFPETLTIKFRGRQGLDSNCSDGAPSFGNHQRVVWSAGKCCALLACLHCLLFDMMPV